MKWAKQGAFNRVKGMKNKSDDVIWDVTEAKKAWKENFKHLYVNESDLSSNGIETNKINISIQGKKDKVLDTT